MTETPGNDTLLRKTHPYQGLQVEHFSDISIVVPIWKIMDRLEREDLTKQRAELGRELQPWHELADDTSKSITDTKG